MTEEHVLTLGKKTNGEPYSCVVVDDSSFMVKNLKRMLNSFDTEVIGTAADGNEAVELVKQHGDDIDFMTLDITMPDKDGLEALEEILEIQPDLTVVMVSAMGQEDTVKQAVMKGAEHFIVKPFEREEVHEKLDDVLNG